MTRVDNIVAQIVAMVGSDACQLGDRLPSIRRAAEEHGVSKNTMAEAYDRLVAQGLLEARAGSGYFVARRDRATTAASQAHVTEAVDLVSLLREQLDHHYAVRPGDGRPPPSWMEGSELRRYFTSFRTTGPETVDFGYGSSWGYGPLRERLRMTLADRSIVVPADGLLLTHGANHALDLIIRHLLEPGDTVFVDDPGYYPLFGKLTLGKIRMIGIRRGPDGPDMDDLAANLAIARPKIFFTQSQAHNPTGSTLSPANAFALLRAAEQHGFLLVENDAFADIVPTSLPRLAALGQLERVLYIGTFSKTLSAGLRSGFVAGASPIVTALSNIKMVTTVATSDYVERFIFNLIDNGHYLRHLRRLRGRVDEAHRHAVAALAGVNLRVGKVRSPGFYLWTELPEHVDELELCRAAATESIFLAPGQVFRPHRSGENRGAIRINVAYATDPRLISFFDRTLQP